MILYLNNCLNRDHKYHYGNGAYYDLYTVGNQADKATNLIIGQECIVASKNEQQVIFSWFKFLCEKIMVDENNDRVRVFFGDLFKTECFEKAEAANIAIYSPFFDKNGNFKRQSVIQK